tara:strand:+ start:3571 stop:3981 length:411 start_codon:yes stop_codon:yes gene_type:complete
MRKYWFGLIIILIGLLLFLYKDSLYISEKVYIVYEKNENFYKNKYVDIFYYKKQGRILKLASFENRKKAEIKYEEIKSLNIITIDSLSKILPFSYYETHLLDKKKIDRLKIFFIEIDTIKNKVNIQEVHQSFIEYD